MVLKKLQAWFVLRTFKKAKMAGAKQVLWVKSKQLYGLGSHVVNKYLLVSRSVYILGHTLGTG